MTSSLKEQQLAMLKEFFSEFPLEDTYDFLDTCFQGALNSELVEPSDGFLHLCQLKKLLEMLNPDSPDLMKPSQVN